MPKRYTAYKVDANQKEIIKTYAGMGVSVALTHAVGVGFPDLVVGLYGVTDLVEVKDGSKIPSKQKLTKDQEIFHDEWRGSIWVIKSVDEAIDHVKNMSVRGRL